MRVSVITPTWQRHELLLRRCIPSVQAQDYPPFGLEHVVVSDGPDPQLADLVYGQVDVFHELPTRDAGAGYGSRARLKGLELATGDLIAYLDDDDAYRPQHCAVLANALAAAGWADFAYSLMSVEGSVVGTDPPGFCHIGTPMIMHRRALLEHGTWGPPGPAEDWDLVSRWLTAGARYVHVPDVTVDVWPGGTGGPPFDPGEELARVFGPR